MTADEFDAGAASEAHSASDQSGARADPSTRFARSGTGRASKRRHWSTLLIVLGFAALFAWDVVEAVGNLIALPQLYAFLGFTTDQVPWWLLILDLALSPILFVTALVVSRGRGPGRTALILLVALAVAAAWSISITSIEPLVRPTLL